MLPLNSQKALFSGEEANVIRFALSIFLQTDFAGLTSKKEEEKAKDLAHLSLDKFTNHVNDFTFKELCVMAGAVDNLIALIEDGETFGISETQMRNCKFFLPAVKQKLIEDFKSKKLNLKNIKELSKKYITKSI